MSDVKGRMVRHCERHGFIYEYNCPRCKKPFRSRAYELSEPTLCHLCYVGGRRGTVRKELRA